MVAALEEDDRVKFPDNDRWEGRGVEKPYADGGLLWADRRVVPCPIEPERIAATASRRVLVVPEKDVARASNAEVEGAAPGGNAGSSLLDRGKD